MNHKPSFRRYSEFSLYITAIAALILVGCGGGGSSSTVTNPPSSMTLSGTAATGAAIAGATVEIKDVVGTTHSTTTNADGAYSLSASGMTGPFLIKVTSLDGSKVFSAALVSDLGGTINATPLTSILVADATNKDLDSLYATYGSADATLLTNNLPATITSLTSTLSPVATALGVTISETGLLRGAFTANHDGLDKAMDALSVSFTGTTVIISDKAGTVIASVDLATTPFAIASSNVTASAATLVEYATATAEISTFLGQMTTDCGVPVLDANGLGNADLYTSTCTAHLYTAIAFLNEGVTNPAVFAPGWWNIAAGNGTVTFSNPIIFGYDATNGYKVRYTYVGTAGLATQIFQAEGYFKKELGIWKFRGDQQNLLLDMNAHRKASPLSSGTDVNVFKLFVSTGAASWAATTVGGLSIDYVVVTGPGLPVNGLTLQTLTTGPDSLPALYACMALQGNLIAATCPDAGAQSGVTFQAVNLISNEGGLANIQRYVFTAYNGAVGLGTELYHAPYWLSLRYEYVTP